MTRYFSLPTSSTSHTKEAREMKGELPKASETGGEKSIGLEEENVATQPGAGASPPSTATTPTKTHNKLRKPRPFSLSVPSSKKRPNALNISINDSPFPFRIDLYNVIRTIQQEHCIVLWFCVFCIYFTFGIANEESDKPSEEIDSPRSSSTSSAPSFDHHHPPSHTPSPSSSSIPSASAAHSRKSSVSQDFTSVKTKEVQFINVNDEHEAKDEHERIPESIPERTSEELDQYNSVSETQPSSEPEPAVVESSPTAAITLGDSDEPLRVQVLESSTIVSTVLSPVAEMPTPITPQVPVPSAAETGDMQPEDVLPVSGPTLSTTAYVEQEVPDPFLVDEEGDAMSDETREEREQDRGASVAPSAASSEPLVAQEIALSVSTTTETTADATSPVASEPLLSPLNVNKDVPPTPPEETEQGEGQEEEEVLDLFLPGLIIPTMLLPIPNTDPLTTLLTKYIYPPEKRPMRDVTGEWKRTDVHTLVMTNSWRALGRMARDRIVAANPADVENILELWYLRLASLARLRLSNQTAAECTNLFLVLNAIEPKEHRHYVFEKILPFELEIMHARIKYWSGDHMGYLDALSALLTKCKRKAREAVAISRSEGEAQEIKEMWKERGARISLILASQLVEMKDFTAATRLLEPLCTQRPHNSRESTITNPTLRSAIARIFIQGGNVQLAAHHFGIVAQDPTADESLKRLNEAILCAAEGEWDRSVELLKGLIEEDEDNFVAVNDLSVTLLSQGKLKEAIEVLEKALSSSPSTVVVAEPILFNLSTLYELRSAAGLEKKKGLLIEVAKWSGDGLRTNCLKMPTS
ncbi:Trafficking protein particle complex subunit 12 [Leucoagaricus sp. SymC.cos]|nr:Trafficking protein particle complex subunit 12 [Leucoagaricus sp. SymC.cos]